MQRLTLSIAIIVAGRLAGAPSLAAQQKADSVDLRGVFSAADSVDGRPVVDSLPQLIQCPQFDARRIRGDATTFSFQRPPTIEDNMNPVSVTLEFVVDKRGRVESHSARVLRSGDSRLDQSFEYWVADCRFQPGKVRGQPVRVRMQREWKLRPVP